MRGYWVLVTGLLGCDPETLVLGQAPPIATELTPPPSLLDAQVGPLPLDAAPAEASPDVAADTDATPPRVPAPLFAPPVVVLELVAETENLNPTLTHDQKSILFNSNGDSDASVGGKDLFLAERADDGAPFAQPVLLELSTPEFDTSPALSADGLTVWFGTRVGEEDAKHLDIYSATRSSRDEAFGEPLPVVELNSTSDDIPRPLGQGGLVMPFASRRDGEYQTYFAVRSSVNESFTSISQAPLAQIMAAGINVEDAFLTDDGLTLLFADGGDLFISMRESATAVPDRPEASIFLAPARLDTVNTEASEIDPWLSPDGRTLYFVSNRDSEEPQIFRAERLEE